MQIGIKTCLLGGGALVLLGAIAQPRGAQAQMDLTPPGVASQPAARPAPVRRAAPRATQAETGAPRTAPLPLPPPEDRPAATALEDEPEAPRLASVPPAAPAAAETPLAAPNRIEDVFRAARAASPAEASPTRPALARAPLPPSRPADAAGAGAGESPAAPVVAPPSSETPSVEAPFAEAPARRVEGRVFSEREFPVGRAVHLATIRRQAEASRVPIDLADAVATIESAYNPQAVGNADEIGLMQLRPSIAKQVGFEGSVQDLFEPETNIRLGVAYLAGAWERAGGNVCEALMKYRTGWDETQMSALSFEYCRRAVVHLNAIGSPLARGVVLPTRTAPAVAGTPLEGASNGRNTGRFNWSDHDSRLKRIDQQFGGQNFGIIARERQTP
jgi:soluble lytic murein transglycosylase-like protein